jgi:xylulokinase
MLEWYRRQFGAEAEKTAEDSGATVWSELMAQATAAPAGAHGAMFLPHFSGATCPQVDDRSRGAFVSLSNAVTQGDLIRAIVEGLNYQFSDIVHALEKGLDTQLERLIVVGGGARNEFWMQNKADVIGRSIEVPAVEEATPLGAAILAGIGVGLYQDEQDACRRVYRVGKTYEPRTEFADVYQERFAAYQKLFPALQSYYRALP